MHHTLPKPAPRFRVKQQQRKALESQKRDVHRLTSIRDHFRCRACGCRCRSTMEVVPDRLEHHEIKFRSLGGEISLSNTLVLCLACHHEAQTHVLQIVGNADQQVTFMRGTKQWHG